ncbi:gibberellin-regulated protein 9-like [Silene latifolia]|uniref:gibberellin-regulated protein 9-like n=1 Tax=Silene latifolia TaxID=37657 RepID=UPI003D770F93
MKKFVGLFIFMLIFMQAFYEALSAGNAANSVTKVHGENDDAALYYKGYHPRKINCSYACNMRCSKTSRKKVCSRACNSCCSRCNCVPPGTSGNHFACPCYARLRTHGNRPKCP